MPSSASNSLRLEEQFTGENINVWGVLLNQAISMIDAGVAGITTVALTGNHTLVSMNYVADEARNAIVKLTGTAPWTVTIPNVSKVYVFWNASSAVQIITGGAGAPVSLQPGEIAPLICDAINVKRVVPTVFGVGPFSMSGVLDMGASKITSVVDPTNPQEAATKAYVDAVAFAANAGILPGQTGANGQALFSNGANALWKQIQSTDLGDAAALLGRSVAFAIAL